MSEFDCGWIDDDIETCMDCKHYPPEKKWPCVDCDMSCHDRAEPKLDEKEQINDGMD